MQFCRGDQLADQAQCCLFNPSLQPSKQNNKQRVSRDGLIGIQSNKNNYKIRLPTQKQLNNASKVSRASSNGEKQKQKVSLSKLSGRKAAYSRDHCEQKQQACKNVIQNNPLMRVKAMENTPTNNGIVVNFYFNEPRVQSLNLQKFKNIQVVPSGQIGKNSEQQFNTQIVSQSVAPAFETHLVGSNIAIYHPENQGQARTSLQNANFVHYECPPPPPVNRGNIRILNKASPKPQTFEPVLMNSVHSNRSHSQVNTSLIENIKGVQTNAPTLQTDRNMICSQVREGNHNQMNRFIPLPNKNSSQIYIREEDSQIGGSRLTETLGPDLGRKNLKTVQSIYGSELGVKKQMQQSVILIDFFNPSQTQRKQIQKKIASREKSQFYS